MPSVPLKNSPENKKGDTNYFLPSHLIFYSGRKQLVSPGYSLS